MFQDRNDGYVGEGEERVVYLHLKDSDKVVGLERASRNIHYIQAAFHLGRVLHLLFPQNFPELFEVSAEQMVMQYIVGDREINRDNIRELQEKIEALCERLQSLGIDPNILSDLSKPVKNFVFSVESVVYLDKCTPLPYMQSERSGEGGYTFAINEDIFLNSLSSVNRELILQEYRLYLDNVIQIPQNKRI